MVCGVGLGCGSLGLYSGGGLWGVACGAVGRPVLFYFFFKLSPGPGIFLGRVVGWLVVCNMVIWLAVGEMVVGCLVAGLGRRRRRGGSSAY